jgi:hypothetical protein
MASFLRWGQRLGASLLLLLASPRVQAQYSSTTFSAMHFPPVGGAHDVLSVQSPRVTPPLRVDTAATLSFAHNLDRLVSVSTGRTIALLENRAALVLGGSVGLLGWAEVGLALPVILWQRGSAAPNLDVNIVAPPPRGVGDLRLSPKAQLWETDQGRIGAGLSVTLPTGGATGYMSWGGVTATPQVLAEGYGPLGLRLLLNAGLAIRPTRGFNHRTLGTAWTYGLAGEWPLPLTGESLRAWGSLQGEWVWREATLFGRPVEALVGALWQAQPDWGVAAAVGKGLNRGYMAAEVQGQVSFFYTPLAAPTP